MLNARKSPAAQPGQGANRVRPRLEILEARALLTFFPPVNYPTMPFSTSVASADFNGDKAADLVVASGDTTVGVRLNNGDGTFKNVANYNSGSGTYWVTVGEFNGDGITDIAVANSFAAKANVLLGNGNGTFQQPKSFATGPDAVHLAAGDVNGDGRQDLVVASAKSNTVNVLLGNGDGTFQPFKKFRAGTDPFGVAMGDFDKDGKPDLVVANLRFLNSSVSILRGNGDGTFDRLLHQFANGRETRHVEAVDMNADGNLDIVAANSGSDTVAILLGNGNGTFRSAKTYPGGLATMHLTVADFDENGTPDVAMVNYSFPVGHVSVLPGIGDGSLGAFTKYEVGNSPFALIAADFDGNNASDLAVVNTFSSNMSVLINSPGRSSQAPANWKQVAHGIGVDVHETRVSVVPAEIRRDGKRFAPIAPATATPVRFFDKSEMQGPPIKPQGRSALPEPPLGWLGIVTSLDELE